MQATVTSHGLHLRSGPNVSAHVVDILGHGQEVTTFGRPDQYGWQMVRAKSGYGYVYAKYLAPVPAPAPKMPPVVTEVRQPEPLPPAPEGRNKDVGTIVVTVIIVAVILAALYGLLR